MKEFQVEFEIDGDQYYADIASSAAVDENGQPSYYRVNLNHHFFGELEFKNGEWRIRGGGNPTLVLAVGNAIFEKIRLDRSS